MMRILMGIVLLLVSATVSAEDSCNCDIYPFRPQICVEKCMSEALGRIAKDEAGKDILRSIGYRRRATELLLQTDGDAEKIRALFEKDASYRKPIEATLKQASQNLQNLGVQSVEGEG